MYHYVRDLKQSAYPKIKGLDVGLFEKQLLYIRDHYTVVSMEEVISCVYENRPLPDNAALLTFDDGYIDHYRFVFPLLKSFGFQGSFYIPTQTVKEHKVLDVNKIHFILAAAPDTGSILADLRELIANNKASFGLAGFAEYYKKLAVPNRFDSAEVIFIKRLLQVELEESVRSSFADILFMKYVNESETAFAKELYVNEEQLREMKDAGMHIGCHGYNHYWWNRLDEAELEREIDLSLSFLEGIGADMQNWTAAYPYGSHSKEVENMLDKKDCRLAFTTVVGIADAVKSSRLTMCRLDTNDIPIT